MNKEFENNLNKWREERLTEAEKERMLKNILAAPVPSPYVPHLRLIAFLSIFFVLSGTIAYASQKSLPGEKLYAIKTRVMEPIVDALNTMPERKLAREEAKIATRLAEAEALAKEDKLDDEKVRVLEKKIEESSARFNQAVEEASKVTATTTEGEYRKKEEFKRAFREKFGDGKHQDKIERLKERALNALEENEEKDQSRD